MSTETSVTPLPGDQSTTSIDSGFADSDTTSSPTSEPTSTPPPPTSNEPPTTSTTTIEETTTSSPSITSSPPPTTSSTPPPTTSEETSSEEETSTSAPTSDPEDPATSTTITRDGLTSVVVVTNTREPPTSTAATSGTSTVEPQPIDPSGGGGGGGLDRGATVAIGVVVPIVAIAIIAIVGLFWWKRRKARLQAQEERRKEVEDYSYNPNADPTIPTVGSGSDGAWEMREDGTGGYRGWGTTVTSSTGNKASTTMSGGGGVGAYSDANSPTRASAPNEPLMGERRLSGDGEILGAMGPSAANNRGGDVQRGASNASSYSAAGRSDTSEAGMGMAYGNGAHYYEQYSQNPYTDDPRGQETPGQAIIRDNPARRNTRIENPSHLPQQSVGISQNF